MQDVTQVLRAIENGEARATNEWLAANPHIRVEKGYPFGHPGQAFIVQLRPE